ncbi:putative TIR domain, P-loop containing nucleoside triphosphate hydrolase [Helianthus annuus]|nr:putative TIR domain, P-loop containing nucleoside triphosphate hydrolase [Helianthus annuus]
MASTYSSASRPIGTRTIRYDVFISFRGADTRYTFTEHLYEALLQAKLRTFRGNGAIYLGDDLKPEVKDAIIESRASVVVLSENYASSRWCLDELSLILEQRKKYNYIVLPVFYHVDPSAIREQGRSFLTEGSNRMVANMTRWKTALTEVAALTGMVLSGCKTYETDFIKEVVETVNNQLDLKQRRNPAHLTGMETVNNQLDLKQPSTQSQLTGMETANSQLDLKQLSILVDLTGIETVNSQLDLKQSSTRALLTGTETINRELDLKQLSTPAHLIGIEPQVEAINSWLRNEQSNVIAICGMGGSGKTTLAKCIYNLYKHDFESSCFVEEIGKHFKHDALELQKQLLRSVSGGKEIRISNVSDGACKIVGILQVKKVLIVLDDIDDRDQLNTLLGTRAFTTQSKIIITTRLLHTDAWRCWVHELKLLNDLESLELLCWHAFGSKFPMEGFEEPAKQLAQFCGGNPLALKVLGSSLYVNDEDPLLRNSMIAIWRDKMNSLTSLKGDINYNIQCVLRKSFDSLPLSSQRELFLHIACFFIGESRKIVEVLLHDFDAKSGILTLHNRCLLMISPDTDKLMMHQLLQEMARKIVSEESKDTSKYTRVGISDDTYRLLRKGVGSKTIGDVAFDTRKFVQARGFEKLALKTNSLANMEKLKLLHFNHMKHTSNTMMPSGSSMSNLVVIDMSCGDMETFEVPAVLNSLKILALKECYKLVSICNLYRLPKLERLLLTRCCSLTHLCKSIGHLESLALLDLKGCTKLFQTSSNMKGNSRQKHPRIDRGNSEQALFSLPRSLESLYLDFCNVEYDDVQVEFHADSFFNLCLGCNVFEFLPKSIDLNMLRTLDLYSCILLKFLPSIPSTLEELYIDWCCSLERVTFQSGRFRLQHFSYEGCSKLSEVQGIFKLVPISKIREANLVQHMQWIKEYEHLRMDLVSDEITVGKDRQIQMLYEYGIMSTYVQGGIQGQSMATYESSVSNDKDRGIMLAKISNKTKGLTWVYNPLVYGKPRVDEDVVWLSYWPIGNILDAGDEVLLEIICEKGMMIVTRCDASLVYMDGEVDEEENSLNKSMKDEGAIGGDLYQFEVTTGGYYLCRRDLFGSETGSWFKLLFGDNVHYPESHGWEKTRRSRMSNFRKGMVLSGNDVYLSFKGEDTRHTFTDHLYHALLRVGFRTFRDNDAIHTSQELAPAIETAINESRAYIVVLSPDYANSRWCLDELCLILEQRRKLNHFVLPIFYHVDPSDVRNQTGSFLIEKSNWMVDDVRRWEGALTEVANLTGMVLSGSDADNKDFIARVIDTINRELGPR